MEVVRCGGCRVWRLLTWSCVCGGCGVWRLWGVEVESVWRVWMSSVRRESYTSHFVLSFCLSAWDFENGTFKWILYRSMPKIKSF